MASVGVSVEQLSSNMSDILLSLIVEDVRSLKSEQNKLGEDLKTLESRLMSALQNEDAMFHEKVEQVKELALCCPPTVVTISKPESQQDLGLDRDSELISPCFCSHPLGYKLCLALKSSQLCYPMPRKVAARKPKLQVAIIAVAQEDDNHRSWPCEGKITLKIIHQRLCDPFEMEFSINEPIKIDEVFSKTNKWVPLPENVIPFSQFRSPGGVGTLHNVPGVSLNIRIEEIILSEKSKMWHCFPQ